MEEEDGGGGELFRKVRVFSSLRAIPEVGKWPVVPLGVRGGYGSVSKAGEFGQLAVKKAIKDFPRHGWFAISNVHLFCIAIREVITLVHLHNNRTKIAPYVYGVVINDEDLLIVMDRYEGSVDEVTLPLRSVPKLALSIFNKVCLMLNEEIVHRDLKSSNVVVKLKGPRRKVPKYSTDKVNEFDEEEEYAQWFRTKRMVGHLALENSDFLDFFAEEFKQQSEPFLQGTSKQKPRFFARSPLKEELWDPLSDDELDVRIIDFGISRYVTRGLRERNSTISSKTKTPFRTAERLTSYDECRESCPKRAFEEDLWDTSMMICSLWSSFDERLPKVVGRSNGVKYMDCSFAQLLRTYLEFGYRSYLPFHTYIGMQNGEEFLRLEHVLNEAMYPRSQEFPRIDCEIFVANKLKHPLPPLRSDTGSIPWERFHLTMDSLVDRLDSDARAKVIKMISITQGFLPFFDASVTFLEQLRMKKNPCYVSSFFALLSCDTRIKWLEAAAYCHITSGKVLADSLFANEEGEIIDFIGLHKRSPIVKALREFDNQDFSFDVIQASRELYALDCFNYLSFDDQAAVICLFTIQANKKMSSKDPWRERLERFGLL